MFYLSFMTARFDNLPLPCKINHLVVTLASLSAWVGVAVSVVLLWLWLWIVCAACIVLLCEPHCVKLCLYEKCCNSSFIYSTGWTFLFILLRTDVKIFQIIILLYKYLEYIFLCAFLPIYWQNTISTLLCLVSNHSHWHLEPCLLLTPHPLTPKSHHPHYPLFPTSTRSFFYTACLSVPCTLSHIALFHISVASMLKK